MLDGDGDLALDLFLPLKRRQPAHHVALPPPSSLSTLCNTLQSFVDDFPRCLPLSKLPLDLPSTNLLLQRYDHPWLLSYLRHYLDPCLESMPIRIPHRRRLLKLVDPPREGDRRLQ